MRKFRRSWILIFLVVLLFSGKAWLEKYISSTAIEEVSPGKVVYWLARSHSEEAVLGGLMAGLGFKEVLSEEEVLRKRENEASQWN